MEDTEKHTIRRIDTEDIVTPHRRGTEDLKGMGIQRRRRGWSVTTGATLAVTSGTARTTV